MMVMQPSVAWHVNVTNLPNQHVLVQQTRRSINDGSAEHHNLASGAGMCPLVNTLRKHSCITDDLSL